MKTSGRGVIGAVSPPLLSLVLDEGDGQFYVPTALPLGKEPLVPIG
jgi:hypothetical protein